MNAVVPPGIPRTMLEKMTREECTAAPGTFRVVVLDTILHTEQVWNDDYPDLEAAKTEAANVAGPQLTQMSPQTSHVAYVFDDKGVMVHQEGSF